MSVELFVGSRSNSYTRTPSTGGNWNVSGSKSFVGKRLETLVRETSLADVTGWRDPTNFLATDQLYTQPSGSWREVVTGFAPGYKDVYQASGCLSADSVPGYLSNVSLPEMILATPTVPSRMLVEATNKALIDLKAQQVNYAVLLAELGESLTMIAETGVAIASAYRSVRKGNLLEAAMQLVGGRKGNGGSPNLSHLKRFGKGTARSKWLELQFGWLPLVNDVYSVWKQIHEGVAKLTLTGRGKSYTSDASTSVEIIPGWMSTVNTSTEKSVFVRIDYSGDLSHLRRLAASGLTNPAEVIWELTPLSFLWDYFNPVGEFLSTLDASLGLTWKGGSISTRTVVNEQRSYTPRPQATNYTRVVTGSASATGFRKDVGRSKMMTEPSGGLYLRNPLSITRAINVFALFSQLRK